MGMQLCGREGPSNTLGRHVGGSVLILEERSVTPKARDAVDTGNAILYRNVACLEEVFPLSCYGSFTPPAPEEGVSELRWLSVLCLLS